MTHIQQTPHNPYLSNGFIVQQSLPGIPPAWTSCSWVTEHGYRCNAALQMDRDIVSAHLRNEHAIGGDSKDWVICSWSPCYSRPIRRGSLIRHILSVHLGLLKWTCPVCSRTFSRKGTRHNCHVAGHNFLNP